MECFKTTNVFKNNNEFWIKLLFAFFIYGPFIVCQSKLWNILWSEIIKTIVPSQNFPFLYLVFDIPCYNQANLMFDSGAFAWLFGLLHNIVIKEHQPWYWFTDGPEADNDTAGIVDFLSYSLNMLGKHLKKLSVKAPWPNVRMKFNLKYPRFVYYQICLLRGCLYHFSQSSGHPVIFFTTYAPLLGGMSYIWTD